MSGAQHNALAVNGFTKRWSRKFSHEWMEWSEVDGSKIKEMKNRDSIYIDEMKSCRVKFPSDTWQVLTASPRRRRQAAAPTQSVPCFRHLAYCRIPRYNGRAETTEDSRSTSEQVAVVILTAAHVRHDHMSYLSAHSAVVWINTQQARHVMLRPVLRTINTPSSTFSALTLLVEGSRNSRNCILLWGTGLKM